MAEITQDLGVAASASVITQRQLFESYMQLAQFASASLNNRQQYQWKITLGFWALLAAGVSKRGDLHVHDLPCRWIWLFAVLVVFAVTWSRPIWVGNERDKRVTYHFRDAADQVLRDPAYRPSETPDQKQKLTRTDEYFGFLCSWVTWFEVPVTAVLLLLLQSKP